MPKSAVRLVEHHLPASFPGWWLSGDHSLRRQASRAIGARPGLGSSRGVRTRLAAWEVLSSWRVALAVGLIAAMLALVLGQVIGDPPAAPDDNLLIGLWQVLATLLGLALALIVFALQSGGASPALRRDLTVSSSFYSATNLGLVLVVVTGVAAIATEESFGMWLGVFVLGGSAVWAVVFGAAVREAVRSIDPVYRVANREHVMMRATAAALERELLRNVALSILQIEVEAAGGVFYPWVVARAELEEDTRVRAGRGGQLRDANLREIREVMGRWAERGAHGQIAFGLWDQLLPESLIAQVDGTINEEAAALRSALRIGRPERARSVRDQIGVLRVEAEEALGPDTATLGAVLQAYEHVLERYAIGWRVHVETLEVSHITGFSPNVGEPFSAARDAVFGLMDAAVSREATAAAFDLAYWPVHMLRLAVGWRAPAYFEFLAAYPYIYRRFSSASPTFQERLLDRSWLHLVEFLELVSPTMRPPYTEGHDEAALGRAERRVRQALWEVLRPAVQAGDSRTAAELMRRWRIAEERGTREASPRIAAGLPILWEVVRQVRAGKLQGAGAWLRLAAGDARFDAVFDALREQLDPEVRDVNLDDWDASDRPSHEGHIIDSTADLVRATLLLGALTMGARMSPRTIHLTRSMYESRDSVIRVLDEMTAGATQFERLYELEALVGKLAVIRSAWDIAAAEYERAERDSIRSATVAQASINAFATAVQEAWSSGHPRSTLVARATLLSGTQQTQQPLAIRTIADKQFFIDRPESAGAPVDIGKMNGEALLQRELNAIAAELKKLRGRTYGRATLTERLDAAIHDLGGRADIVILIPLAWDVRQTLIAEGGYRLAATIGAGREGRFRTTAVFDLDTEVDWVAVIALEAGLIVEQGGPPTSTVETIDGPAAALLEPTGFDPGGDPAETYEERCALRVIIVSREYVRLRVNRNFARRIVLPSARPDDNVHNSS